MSQSLPSSGDVLAFRFKRMEYLERYVHLYRYGSGVPRDEDVIQEVVAKANSKFVNRMMDILGCDREQVIWLMYYSSMLQCDDGYFHLDETNPNSMCHWDRSAFGRRFWEDINECWRSS